MNNDFIDGIIHKHELRKRDCDKLLEVCEVIEASRKNSENPFFSCDVLISSLQAKGLSYKDIRSLEDIWLDMTGSHPFTISNSGYFEPKNNNWIYGDDLKEKSTKYVVLKLISFVYKDFREKLESLKSKIPDNSGIITLYMEDESLKRNFEGEILSCDFKGDMSPLLVLNCMITAKRSLKGSEFADTIENKKKENWSRVIAGINDRAYKELKLHKREPLIKKDRGYVINRQKYNVI